MFERLRSALGLRPCTRPTTHFLTPEDRGPAPSHPDTHQATFAFPFDDHAERGPRPTALKVVPRYLPDELLPPITLGTYYPTVIRAIFEEDLLEMYYEDAYTGAFEIDCEDIETWEPLTALPVEILDLDRFDDAGRLIPFRVFAAEEGGQS